MPSSIPLLSTVQSPPSPWVDFRPAVSGRPPLGPKVLACIGFGDTPERNARQDARLDNDPRLILAGLPLLAPRPVYEIWSSEHRVDWGRDAGVSFARDGEVLFGSLFVPEFELDEMAAATFKAYARITALLERQGYPWLLRCWNFLHDINRGQSDGERYKQFCVGRYQALSQTQHFEHQLPAGTAIGLKETGLLIYFLAAKESGARVENPRQMPAFQYPRQYGPRSPSFSRATLWRRGAGAQLLVSGTASVVGHATRHPGETLPQLDETLENLKALLDHVAPGASAGDNSSFSMTPAAAPSASAGDNSSFSMTPAAALAHLGGGNWTVRNLKLYLRHDSDLAAVRSRCEQKLGPGAPLLILHGDICRSDLMLEIEGVYAAPSASAGDRWASQ